MSESIGEEWPPECCKLAAVGAAIVPLALTVVQLLPAHELLAVTDGCYPEYLLNFTSDWVLSLEFNGFPHFYITTASNLRVAEVLRLLNLESTEL